jgi:hypothetical protein
LRPRVCPPAAATAPTAPMASPATPASPARRDCRAARSVSRGALVRPRQHCPARPHTTRTHSVLAVVAIDLALACVTVSPPSQTRPDPILTFSAGAAAGAAGAQGAQGGPGDGRPRRRTRATGEHRAAGRTRLAGPARVQRPPVNGWRGRGAGMGGAQAATVQTPGIPSPARRADQVRCVGCGACGVRREARPWQQWCGGRTRRRRHRPGACLPSESLPSKGIRTGLCQSRYLSANRIGSDVAVKE